MPAGGGLERLTTWLYRRTGRYYLYALLALVVASVVFVILPVFVAIFWPSWHGDWDLMLRVLAVYEATLFFGGTPVLLWVVSRRHRPLFAYLRGEPVRADAVWTSAVRHLPRTVALVVGWYSVLTLVGVVYVGAENDFSLTAQLAYAIAVLMLVVGVGAYQLMFFEFAARPIARETAIALPEGFAAEGSGLPLGGKLLGLLFAVCLFTGIAVAGLAAAARDLEETLIVTVVAALGVAGTLAGVLVLLLRHSVLARVDELRRALGAVRAGGSEVRLPPLGGDELDEVGHAFNEMVERLERHSQEMAESRSRIVAAADMERRRMERDLHDGAQQRLVLLQLKLGMLERQTQDDPRLAAGIAELRADMSEAISELRDLAHGIYPAVLENEGLGAALQQAAGRAAIPATVELDGGICRQSREVEAAVYFCCLEALQNAAKHAGDGASAVVSAGEAEGEIHFAVSDTGVGFNGAAAGHGVQNMRDRIGALGGDLRVTSSRGGGTRVQGRVPCA